MQKVLDQCGNSLLAIAQRGEWNRHNIEAVVQVFPKFAFLHSFFEIPRRGRHQSQIENKLG